MKKLMYILALVHLLLITVVIFHGLDDLIRNTILEKPLAFLCSLNYSVWQYGFFSPDVGKSTEVEIKLYEDNGTVKEFSTLEGFRFFVSNAEAANRFYGFKVNTASDTTFLDLCSRSAAVRLLNLYPSAWRVDYTMRSIRYPTMAGYLNQDTIQQITLYQTAYEFK